MTPITIEPRTPREFAAVLDYYREHRAAHPLPDHWSADVSGLERAAADIEQLPSRGDMAAAAVGLADRAHALRLLAETPTTH